MQKRHYIQVLILTLVITMVIEIFFGSYIAAVVSTWPLVRKLGILDPRAPIVINRRETVRVSDSGDIHDAVDGIKSKLSTVAIRSNGQVSAIGAAINLSADGIFLTGRGVLSGDPNQYVIVLEDGRTAAVGQIISDPASNTVLLKAPIDRVPVADVKESKSLAAGDRALFVYNSLPAGGQNFFANFITVAQQAGLGQVFNADRPSRVFGVMPMNTLVPGEAIIDLSGNVIGMWTGTEIISSDVMRSAYESYFSSKSVIARPMFGFSYKMIGKTESGLSGTPVGAQVTQVVAGSPAQSAGLQAGDVITKIDDTGLDQSSMLEEILEKYKPGDQIALTTLRNKQPVKMTLTVGSLK